MAAALGVASLIGVAWRRRNGRFTAVTASASPTLAALGWQPGTPLTLVQFSSAFCAPCRATRVLCGQVASTIDGVRHLEVDAESHLDAVREFAILRTPTVLLVNAAGEVVRRASGLPTRTQLLTAVDAALGGSHAA